MEPQNLLSAADPGTPTVKILLTAIRRTATNRRGSAGELGSHNILALSD